MHQFSDEAVARPSLTMRAAAVLHENAAYIASIALNIQSSQMVVAIVKKDLTFGGVQVVERENLVDKVKVVEAEGAWSLIFSAQVSVAEIEERCTEWQQLASRRGEIMQQRADRQAQSSSQG